VCRDMTSVLLMNSAFLPLARKQKTSSSCGERVYSLFVRCSFLQGILRNRATSFVTKAKLPSTDKFVFC
jgi:hypothetical protein